MSSARYLPCSHPAAPPSLSRSRKCLVVWCRTESDTLPRPIESTQQSKKARHIVVVLGRSFSSAPKQKVKSPSLSRSVVQSFSRSASRSVDLLIVRSIHRSSKWIDQTTQTSKPDPFIKKEKIKKSRNNPRPTALEGQFVPSKEELLVPEAHTALDVMVVNDNSLHSILLVK